jgi:hypothetical protein
MQTSRLAARHLIIGLAVLMAAAAMRAQETRGTIRGRIVDSSGAVIPNVKVGATNLATNVNVSTLSNSEGNYEIPFLLPGRYRLNAELTGFKAYRREGVEVRIGDRVTLEIPMQVGEVQDQVTVTAETPLLESATASMGSVVDRQRIRDLPVAHGNPYLLMTLSTGLVHTQNPGLDEPFAPTHVVGYSMDGVRANRSEITLDGSTNVAVNNRWGADLMAGWTPPSDVVQEFKVQTTSFDASVGHTQGGVTAITLKSGGNQLHGSAYFSDMEKVLDANLFFANKAGQPRGDFAYRNWGASLTGPVYIPKLYNGKNRTFFTYAYEGAREDQPQGAGYGAGTLTVPTVTQKQGDFSALLKLGTNYQIYDPATRAAAANGRYTIQPLPGNIIPADRINPIAKKILSYYSDPNVPGTPDGQNNLIRVNDIEISKYYSNVARLDHNFSAHHRMFGRYNMYKRFTPDTGDWFRAAPTGVFSSWRQNGAAIDDVYELSPRTILNARYAFYRLVIYQYPQSVGFDPLTLGFPESYIGAIDPAVLSFPAISISGYQGTVNNWWRYPHQSHSVEGNVTALRGAHMMKFGGDGRQFRTFQFQPHNSSTGSFVFDPTYTRGPFDNSPSAPMGQSLAAFLLGIPSGGGVDKNATFAEQSTVWSLYFQNDWKLTRRLTLNLGVRWEVEGPTSERFDRSVRGFDFTSPNPLDAQVRANYAKNPIPEIPVSDFHLVGGLTYPGVNGQPRTLFSRDWNNLMPRIGFAFQVDNKTVVRGGYGVYFGPLGIQRNDVIQSGFSQTTSLIPTLDNGLTFAANLDNPFPNGILLPRGSADGLLTFAGRNISFYEESPRAPRQQRWQLSIQRELPKRVLMEVSYVGNQGDSMQVSRDYRPLPLQYLSRSPFRDQVAIDYLSAQVPNPFYPLLPGTGLSGTTVSRSYLLSSGMYPQFTGMTGATYDGWTRYDSLQVRVERRLAQGFTFNASYQWSKMLEGSSRLNGQLSPLEKVVSDQDRAQRFVTSVIWELPFGRGRKFMANAPAVADTFLGGWQIEGIYTGQGGPPLSWGNVLFIGDIHDITVPVSQRSPDRWFDVDAGFNRNSAQQLASNFRTFPSRLSNVRADGMNVWDLSVIKAARLRENMHLQFRGEFLNAWNHPMFSGPNTNPTSSAFGVVTSQRAFPRRIQLGLKLLF